MLPEPDHHAEIRYPAFLVRGVDTGKLATNQVFGLGSPMVITGTYSYTGGVGTKQTVLVMDTDPKKLELLLAAKRERSARERKQVLAAREAAMVRTWTTKERGNEQQVFVAKFLKVKGKWVYLERDGKPVGFHWFNLSKEDQKWVLAELRDTHRGLAAASVESEPQAVAQTGDAAASVNEEIERIKKAMKDDDERLRNATSASERRRLEHWLKTYKERLAAQEKKLVELEQH